MADNNENKAELWRSVLKYSSPYIIGVICLYYSFPTIENRLSSLIRAGKKSPLFSGENILDQAAQWRHKRRLEKFDENESLNRDKAEAGYVFSIDAAEQSFFWLCKNTNSLPKAEMAKCQAELAELSVAMDEVDKKIRKMVYFTPGVTVGMRDTIAGTYRPYALQDIDEQQRHLLRMSFSNLQKHGAYLKLLADQMLDMQVKAKEIARNYGLDDEKAGELRDYAAALVNEAKAPSKTGYSWLLNIDHADQVSNLDKKGAGR